MSLKVIFEKLYPSYSKKLWKYILDESINLFIQMIIICSLKYNPEDKQKLVQKMMADKVGLQDLYKNILSTKDIENAMNKILTLANAFLDSAENVVEHLFKLKTTMGNHYNDNCSKCILRMRHDLPKEVKKEIFEGVEKKANDQLIAERKEKAKAIQKTPMLEFKIKRMVANFRKRMLRRKAEIEEKEREKQENDSLLKLGHDAVDQNELMGTRATLDFGIEKILNVGQIAYFKENPNRISYEKQFICFFDDIIAWKKKSTSSNVEGKVFLVSITDIGISKDLYMYFVDF